MSDNLDIIEDKQKKIESAYPFCKICGEELDTNDFVEPLNNDTIYHFYKHGYVTYHDSSGDEIDIQGGE